MGRRRSARGRHRAGSAARGAAARRPALGRGAGRAGRAHGRRPDLVGRHVAGGDGEPAPHRGRAGPVDGSRAASGKVGRARRPLAAAAPRGAGARARTAPVRGQRDRGPAPVRRAARGRPVRAGRPESRHAGRVQAAGPGRGELRHGTRPGGVRDGQGGRRPRHAPERTARIGRVEQAGSGTLFLDEIADMSLALQAKILRAVQEREIERVGGGETIPIDVRLIAATNRDLKEAIKQGRFREDLYYRLAVVTIRLPTLVERGDDLLLLTAYFVRQFAERYRKQIHAISDRALELLRNHAWIGNVRELRNVIERAVIVATDDVLRAEHLPEEFRGEEATLPDRPEGALLTLAEVEARHITRVLAHTNHQIGAAAEILGIHRNTLTRKMKEYGL